MEREEREGRESSTASSVDFYDDGGAGPAKRKADALELPEEKKRKLGSPSPSPSASLTPCAGLPPAVWQHVFLSCSLHDLGRLLQVNRSFRSYLTDVSGVSHSHSDPSSSGSLRLLKSESVWASARNALPVKPPKPLAPFTELQMWQLVWSRRCQFCRKESSFAPGEKIWQKGPGANGVRTIWPFGIRSCGPCILRQCQTDATLLFSPTASALRPALPFAFVTNDYNYIPAYTLQVATTPAGVEIVKYYYRKHVDGIVAEFNDALGRGNAAVEEWSKGLEARGNERMKMAEHWERWEVKYQWWRDHHPHRCASQSPAPAPAPDKHNHNNNKEPSPVIYAPVPATKSPLASNFARDGNLLQRYTRTPPHTTLTTLTPAATPSQYMLSRPPTVPHQYTPHPASGSVGPGRSERNLHDANEAKANRKTDIERRCQHMVPPIPPSVLRHMDSFKAALQISQPMTDYAWSVLQPRLLAQLPAAQQAEADHVSRSTCTSKAADRRPLDVNSKEAKEVMDREWDDAQRPVRDRLSAVADDFILRDWDRGSAVTYENSPKFAVDVLVYVRSAYVRADGGEPYGSPLRPRLILENMKWVYDNKVKPLTEQFRKEIFLCYGNGCENNVKFYGFEGVIQHFGAKHTNAFSVGNVVVAWREAEWPEETPFHPDPISVKHAHHPAPNPAGHTAYAGYYGGYSRAGTSTPHMQSHLPQPSPGPYHYSSHYGHGPYPPPQLHSAATQAFDYGQSYSTQMDAFQYQSMPAPSYGHQSGNGYMASPAMTNPAMAPLATGQPHGPGTYDTSHKPAEADHRTSMYDKQVSTVIDMARDIWKQTSGIQNLPSSVRVYVLLQRVISKFYVEFNHEPNLNHFVDAFSNHKIPRALKDASGLSCKACRVQSPQYYSGQEDRRAFTVLNLLTHFKSQHSGTQAPSYGSSQSRASKDWKEDMIELPNDRIITGLIHAPGMDDDKLLMVATVFPTLFPTPLPKIGIVEGNGPASPAPGPVDPKEGPKGAPPSGSVAKKPGPSSLASRDESPRKPEKEEYDPQRPVLPGLANQPAAHANRRHSYRASPSTAERRGRSHTDSQYFLPRENAGRDLYHSGEPLDYAVSPRRIRSAKPYYEEYQRRPMYRDQGGHYHHPGNDEMGAQPHEGAYAQSHRPSSRHVRYMEEHGQPSDYRYARESGLQEHVPEEKSEADRFLEEFVPSRPPTNEQADLGNAPRPDADMDDGSRYTPSPANQASVTGLSDQRRIGAPLPPPSTVSNGSRYEEHRMDRRAANHTPDSGRGLRRPGPQRRRDRHHDHVPSRYYRYMSVARDEPYSRGASISRSQSKRYEEQRRRIDQQETPQPNAEPEPPFSRDHSVERAPADNAPPHSSRIAGPREYISVQDRLHPYSSPPRYRYADYPPEDTRGAPGPAPVYVDEFGQRVHEYEIIRLPRESRPHHQYMPHHSHHHSHPSASARYVDHHGHPHDPDVRYVSYDAPPPSHNRAYDGRSEYVYYEERERERDRDRRRLAPAPVAYESEGIAAASAAGVYDIPPPEVKIESKGPDGV
ncbi:hypothetical protein P280DRAFT_521902 [Massarina eburnea CBS 473.64]|uniref:DUF7892 domain-containing protein n=1 Tax=Massarina eburnea CBS 473.64 TaxID=1395130 RepID=A0A6A6RPW5_9PLEO|nr:hypothetical protein P280DRAFT_521902 [Massarina eburnea CBS 473.64]